MAKRNAPSPDEARLRSALRDNWGIEGRLTELPVGSMSRAWRVDPPTGPPVVAKLAVNSLDHFELGLRVSQEVSRAVLPTGVPIPTLTGDLAIEHVIDGAAHSFAALEFVRGSRPADPYRFGPAELGSLLGRIHAGIAHLDAGAAWTFADVVTHIRSGVLPDHPSWVSGFVTDTLAAVEDWLGAAPRRQQLLRGDGPELLVDEDRVTGMIDWGATRFGSVADDIGCWTVHYGRVYDTYAAFSDPFIDAYIAQAPLTAAEVEAVPLFQALRLASRPIYQTDPQRLALAKTWIDQWRTS